MKLKFKSKGTRSLSDIYQRSDVAIVEPSGYEEAVADKIWVTLVKEELEMFLVYRPIRRRTLPVKWIYRTRVNPDVSINKHKVRLVVKGYEQMY